MKFTFLTIVFSFFISSSLAREKYKKSYIQKNSIDRAHENFSQGILNFSNNIDRFFSDSSDLNIQNKSKLKVSLDMHFREGRGPYLVPEINYRLILPRTERRFQLFLESDDEEEKSRAVGTNKGTSLRSSGAEESSTTAGLRYIVKKSGIDFSTDTGVLVNVPIVLFAKLNAKKVIPFTQWSLKIKEQLKWVNDDGFTSNLSLNFDRPLTRKFLWRFINNIFWNDQDYSIRFTNGPSFFHQINRKITMAYHAHINSVNKPDFVLENYIFQISYRQLVYKKWAYMQLSPFLHFPRTNNFHRTPGFVLSLDAAFGHI